MGPDKSTHYFTNNIHTNFTCVCPQFYLNIHTVLLEYTKVWIKSYGSAKVVAFGGLN